MGFKINHKKVLRIMHKYNILAKVRRKKRKFNSGATSVIVSNILKSEYGAIIRTSAIGISENVLKDEINELKDRWQYIQEKAAKTKIVPTELYNNYGIIGKLITDFEPNGLEIVVENNKTKKIIEDIIKQKDENAKLQSNIVIKVEPIEMIEEFKRKVWL